MSFIKLINVYKCRRDCILNGCKKRCIGFYKCAKHDWMSIIDTVQSIILSINENI